jgi:CRISPR/Cas system-associated exonuclease Cas4 (RecB family)
MAIKIKQVQWFDNHFYKVDLEEKKKIVEKYLASITTKLGAESKAFLLKWYADLGWDEAQKRKMQAAERGSRVHFAWFLLKEGGAIIYNPPQHPNYTPDEIHEIYKEYDNKVVVLHDQGEMWDVHKLKIWIDVVNPKFIDWEFIVYDLENNEAGQVDDLVEIQKGEYEIAGSQPLKLPGGIYVHDLKTGKSVGDSAKMQTAAYAKMVEKNLNIEVDGILITHTGASTRKGIQGLNTLYVPKEEIDVWYQDYRNVAAVWDRQNKNPLPKIFEFPSLITLKKGA